MLLSNYPIYLVSANPEKNHNYGYDLYLPDIEIEQGSTFTVLNDKVKVVYAFDHKKDYYASFPHKNFETNYSPKIIANGRIENKNKKKLSFYGYLK